MEIANRRLHAEITHPLRRTKSTSDLHSVTVLPILKGLTKENSKVPPKMHAATTQIVIKESAKSQSFKKTEAQKASDTAFSKYIEGSSTFFNTIIEKLVSSMKLSEDILKCSASFTSALLILKMHNYLTAEQLSQIESRFISESYIPIQETTDFYTAFFSYPAAKRFSYEDLLQFLDHAVTYKCAYEALQGMLQPSSKVLLPKEGFAGLLKRIYTNHFSFSADQPYEIYKLILHPDSKIPLSKDFLIEILVALYNDRSSFSTDQTHELYKMILQHTKSKDFSITELQNIEIWISNEYHLGLFSESKKEELGFILENLLKEARENPPLAETTLPLPISLFASIFPFTLNTPISVSRLNEIESGFRRNYTQGNKKEASLFYSAFFSHSSTKQFSLQELASFLQNAISSGFGIEALKTMLKHSFSHPMKKEDIFHFFKKIQQNENNLSKEELYTLHCIILRQISISKFSETDLNDLKSEISQSFFSEVNYQNLINFLDHLLDEIKNLKQNIFPDNFLTPLQTNNNFSAADLKNLEKKFRLTFSPLYQEEANLFYSAFFSYPLSNCFSEEDLAFFFHDAITSGHEYLVLKKILNPRFNRFISSNTLVKLIRSIQINQYYFSNSNYFHIHKLIITHLKMQEFPPQELISFESVISKKTKHLFLTKPQLLEIWIIFADLLKKANASQNEFFSFISSISEEIPTEELFQFLKDPIFDVLSSETTAKIKNLCFDLDESENS